MFQWFTVPISPSWLWTREQRDVLTLGRYHHVFSNKSADMYDQRDLWNALLDFNALLQIFLIYLQIFIINLIIFINTFQIFLIHL